MTIAEAVADGSRRRSLEALRDRLATEIDNCAEDGRTLVQLAKELRTVVAELDALPLDKEVSAVDEVAERRARRRANTTAATGS